MPKKLAAKEVLHAFWYKPNVSPPKDWAKWDDLVTQFAQHLIDRYGIDEVSQWYFEVWNEPNLDFWAGDPKQADLLRALRPHRARLKERESAPARRRPRHCSGRLGRRTSSATASTITCRWISSPPTSTATTGGGCFRHAREHPAQPDGLPRRAAKFTIRSRHPRCPTSATHLERVQRQLQERAGSHRLRLHGPVAGGHDPAMRRPGRHACPTGRSPMCSKNRAW